MQQLRLHLTAEPQSFVTARPPAPPAADDSGWERNLAAASLALQMLTVDLRPGPMLDTAVPSANEQRQVNFAACFDSMLAKCIY